MDWTQGAKHQGLRPMVLDGAVYADNRNDLRIRKAIGYDDFEETKMKLEELTNPYNDPFSYFAAVIKGEIKVSPSDLSSLENNMTVMEILDAAIRSAKKGKTIFLKRSLKSQIQHKIR